ncbi:MAG TPA: HDOD domain-containing protein, partial [candidate division Zixibacteria bacterium]|nr:HDOD domain-containing protein [candidate division Zixibacteria bacterium]
PNGIESRLWEHSLASAIAARLIARTVRHPEVEECYLAGLLHDVGKLIFVQRFPNEYRELLRKSSADGAELIQLEADEFNFTHPQLGAALLREWSFPEVMSEAVSDHHVRVASASSDCGEQQIPIAVVVRLANEIAGAIGVGLMSSERVELTLKDSWSAQALGLSEEELSELIERVKETFTEEKSLFH